MNHTIASLALMVILLAGCNNAPNSDPAPPVEPNETKTPLPQNYTSTGLWVLSVPSLGIENAHVHDFELPRTAQVTMTAYAGDAASTTVEIYDPNGQLLWAEDGALGQEATGTVQLDAGSYRAFAYMATGAAANYRVDVTFAEAPATD